MKPKRDFDESSLASNELTRRAIWIVRVIVWLHIAFFIALALFYVFLVYVAPLLAKFLVRIGVIRVGSPY